MIDSSNLLHRAVWIAENVRTNVNPSYIFLTSVRKYVNMFECKNVFSIWDKRLIRGIKNYRRQATQAEYKGTRDEEKNARVFSYEDVTTELLNMLGVKNMYPGILEADDVISWLCDQREDHTVVVSVDQDMLQLVNDSTTVYSPIKDVLYDVDNFEQSIGVPVSQFLRYKSLMGDKSDNLPGVYKCGPKTAKKLITEHVDDESLLSKLGPDKLKPYFFNLKMIDLKQGHMEHPDDVKLYEQQHEQLRTHEPDMEQFFKRCDDLNMNNITTKKHDWTSCFTDQTKNMSKTLADIVNGLT